MKIQFVPQIGSEGDSFAFSSDGKHRLTRGTTPNVLLLWDVATSRLIRTFDNQIGTIVSASFSPNGMTIVLASSDHTLRLFDAATGNLLQTFEGHTGRINSVAFSPDGTRILSGSHDKTLAVWDVTAGKMIRRFKAHENKITCVSFSPDGTKSISGSSDQTLKLFDMATGEIIQSFKGHGGEITSVVFSSDGTRILSGSWDRTAKLWDTRTGELIFSLDGHSGWVTAVTFSVDGKYLLTMSLDTLQLWDASTGKRVEIATNAAVAEHAPIAWQLAAQQSIKARSGDVEFVSFSRDKTYFISSVCNKYYTHTMCGKSSLKVWDAKSGALIRSIDAHKGGAISVAVSPDGAQLISSGCAHWLHGTMPTCIEGELMLWDTATGELVRSFEGHRSEVTSVVFSPDGTRVLSSGGDVRLWDTATGTLIRAVERHYFRRVTSVAFSPDGTRILAVAADHTLELWDSGTGELIREIREPDGIISTAAFSPDGTRLLVVNGGTLRLLDAATGEFVRSFGGHPAIASAVFALDGNVLTGNSDGTLTLWEVVTGKPIRNFNGHTQRVNSVAFSSDGTRILSGSADTTMRVWDVNSGKEVIQFLTSPAGKGMLTRREGEEKLTYVAPPSEWIAMSPSGFFYASPGNLTMLSYVRGLEVYSPAQLRGQLERPDLIHALLTGDKLHEYEVAAKELDLEKVILRR